MGSESYELIAELFHDSKSIQILCSIYENEVSADAIANLLDMNNEEVTDRLELLCNASLVNRRQDGDLIVYSLVNPKVCDAILSLRDSISHR